MLKLDGFRVEEKDAPLFVKDFGFLDRVGLEAIFERTAKWPGLVGITNEQGNKMNLEDVIVTDEIKRIVEKDADRTFTHEKYKKRLRTVLHYAAFKFGDYQQGLSYLASFLLLFLDEKTVIKMVLMLHSDTKYIPGYWHAEAVNFAIDANVFWYHILADKDKESYDLLAKQYILPETFMQKWIGGLCIHLLGFDTLFVFMEEFFKHGYIFLFRFALAFFAEMRPKLQKCSNPGEMYAILRMDEAHISLEEAKAIVKKAVESELLAEKDYDYDGLRKEVFETKLKARLEAAKKRIEDADGDTDSDFSESDDDGFECAVCIDRMPEVYCDDCKIIMCEGCHEEYKGKHTADCKTTPLDEIDDVDGLIAQITALKL